VSDIRSQANVTRKGRRSRSWSESVARQVAPNKVSQKKSLLRVNPTGSEILRPEVINTKDEATEKDIGEGAEKSIVVSLFSCYSCSSDTDSVVRFVL
jgi:hypothetical protein